MKACLLLSFLLSIEALSMKRILVTGANKGIGRAIVERLLSEWPNTHVLLGSRSLERGQQAVEEIGKQLNCGDRLECLQLDTLDDASVQQAAKKLAAEVPLYGIINNAAIGWGYSLEDTVNTNYFGVRRVNEMIGKCVQKGGRIVNVASASGPNFVSSLPEGGLKQKLAKPWTIKGGIKELDEMARQIQTDNSYGVSKALLNAYTVLHGKMQADVLVNSCTPGYIKTDLTAGSGATNPPEKGAIPPCFLLMDELIANEPAGRYYGSDCVRSPLDVYRGPGDAPYVNDEDVIDLKEFTVSK